VAQVDPTAVAPAARGWAHSRPPHEVRRYYASFSYQAQSWKKPRRVVAKVEWRPAELLPWTLKPDDGVGRSRNPRSVE